MGSKKAAFLPRKEPVQARSRATVKAILEATAQVLVGKGYEGATTDAVAARAGVSIGTLYQYFPNKESMVTALIRSHVEEIERTLRKALADSADASLECGLRAMVHAGVEAHRVDPALHKVLFEQVPRDQILGDAFNPSGDIQKIVEEFIRKKAPDMRRPRVRMVALVLETTIEALTHRAVVEAPDWMRSGELENEAVRLLGPYLTAVFE